MKPMLDTAEKPLLLISGPTACGKSSLSLKLAAELGVEILNVDSVQVYRGFDIGSAKLTADLRAGIPHHLIDIFSPAEKCDASAFNAQAREAIAKVRAGGHLPILAGGTTLYITTLLHGIAPMPAGDPLYRASLESMDSQTLHQRLARQDNASADRIHPNDRVRIIRALEACELSGRPASEIQGAHAFTVTAFKALILVLCLERTILYQRINRRVQAMIAAGLIEETRSLREHYGADLQGLRSLGYAQAVQMLDGNIPEDSLQEQIAMQTRRYAKRQMTYWRNEPPKRGWKTLPVQDAARSSNKDFQSLHLSLNQLISRIKDRLAEPFDTPEVWYIDAQTAEIL